MLVLSLVSTIWVGVLDGRAAAIVLLQLNFLDQFYHVHVIWSLVLSKHRLEARSFKPFNEIEEAPCQRKNLFFIDATCASLE